MRLLRLAVAIPVLLGLLTCGCGPAVDTEDLGTVLYEIPDIPPATEAPVDEVEPSTASEPEEPPDEGPGKPVESAPAGGDAASVPQESGDESPPPK